MGDNVTTSHRHFVLDGFRQLGVLRPVLFLPFCLLFLVSLSANSLLLFVVASRRSLHSPMCVLVAGMAGVDLCLPLLVVPHMLLSFLLDWRGISLLGCLLQIFWVHTMGAFQSTLLLWMALDRYFAICTPLRYRERMAPGNFLKMALPLALRNVLLTALLVSLAGRLSYCGGDVIERCFCEHMALVELACGDTSLNSALGLMAVFLVSVFDFLFIAASYLLIFGTVLRSGRSGARALQTCVTHLAVMAVSLAVVLVAFLCYRVRNQLPAAVRVFFSTMYLLLPSCFNPVIYGVRTTEIRRHILKTLSCVRLA